jgi:ADP-ribose pyrophosphatase
MKYKILDEKYVYKGFLKIKKATLTHDTFAGKESDKMEVESMDRGDSVAVVLFEKDTQSFIFIKQFRYSTIQTSEGWPIEIVAGMLEENEKPEAGARREIYEEIGYQVEDLEFVCNFYVSPGGTSERIFLFYAEVNSADQVGRSGGIDTEDIELIKIEKAELRRMLQQNLLNDSKTIIGVQYCFLRD